LLQTLIENSKIGKRKNYEEIMMENN